jgi:hypothetical protein
MAKPGTQPPQTLRSGDRVFLVVSLDVRTDKVDARKSVVLEQRPDMLVVGQPDPALPKSMVGQTLEVAMFPPAPPGATACTLPMGYNARVLKLFPGYPGGEKGRSVPALGLTPPSKVWHPAIIRMHVRAQVRPEHGLGVEVTGAEQANILDISGGGALLCIKGGPSLAPGRILRFALIFPEGDRMALEGEVRWTAPDPDPENGGALAGVRFKNLTVTECRYMVRLAQQILSHSETVLKSLGAQKTMPWPTTFKTHG